MRVTARSAVCAGILSDPDRCMPGTLCAGLFRVSTTDQALVMLQRKW
ncbi:hypothetical protein LLH03_08315 [bacterium]|nr:hypothetical protein [bacterium]